MQIMASNFLTQYNNIKIPYIFAETSYLKCEVYLTQHLCDTDYLTQFESPWHLFLNQLNVTVTKEVFSDNTWSILVFWMIPTLRTYKTAHIFFVSHGS